MNDYIRIGHIYFDYNLGPGETGLDCARLITSEDWEWALDENTTWSSHSSDPYGRSKIIALMDSWQERTQFNCLKRDKEKRDMNKKFTLTDNSLLIMAGGSQLNYCHSLKREPTVETDRYSLSFREYI